MILRSCSLGNHPRSAPAAASQIRHLQQKIAMKRSVASSAAAEHWANKKAKVAVSTFHSPIDLMYCPSNHAEGANQDTVMLSNLIGIRDLTKTYQFNFTIDLELLVEYLHPSFIKEKRPITVITGSDLLSSYDEILDFSNYNINQVIAPLYSKYGSHHTKMMVNYYDDSSLEVVIMTANITKLDFGGLSQMCWRSGRLKKGVSSKLRGTRFQKDLAAYIKKYRSEELNDLADDIKLYNFDSVNVDLVASAPGQYSLADLTDDSEIYGYGKLYQMLRVNGLLISDHSKPHNILAQVSSIASPVSQFKTEVSSLFTHVLCPLMFDSPVKLLSPGKKSIKGHQIKFNYTPHVLFPCLRDLAANNVGPKAGTAIHFNYTSNSGTKAQYELLRPFLCKWNNGETRSGRELTPPHVKLYMCDNADNFNSIKWCLLASHNLSKQAWGGGKGFGYWNDIKNYEVSSYELGVLITPTKECKPVYKLNSAAYECLRLPFSLPPTKYDDDDEAWSMQYLSIE